MNGQGTKESVISGINIIVRNYAGNFASTKSPGDEEQEVMQVICTPRTDLCECQQIDFTSIVVTIIIVKRD